MLNAHQKYIVYINKFPIRYDDERGTVCTIRTKNKIKEKEPVMLQFCLTRSNGPVFSQLCLIVDIWIILFISVCSRWGDEIFVLEKIRINNKQAPQLNLVLKDHLPGLQCINRTCCFKFWFNFNTIKFIKDRLISTLFYHKQNKPKSIKKKTAADFIFAKTPAFNILSVELIYANTWRIFMVFMQRIMRYVIYRMHKFFLTRSIILRPFRLFLMHCCDALSLAAMW